MVQHFASGCGGVHLFPVLIDVGSIPAGLARSSVHCAASCDSSSVAAALP